MTRSIVLTCMTLLAMGCSGSSSSLFGSKTSTSSSGWQSATGTKDTPTNPNGAAGNANSTGCTTLSAQIGTPCDANGVSGTKGCINDTLVCQICTPQQTRQVPCPSCGETRNDICSLDGTQWQQGTCSTCPVTTNKCAMQDACVPNTIEYRVCDYCPNGNCQQNSQCFGAKWQCGDDCDWHQQGDCAAQQAECSQDVTPPPQQCGLCGTEQPTCDGCFIHVSDVPCTKQGVCAAGAQVVNPCADQNCAVGATSTTTCSSTCQWNAPSSCDTCTPGATQTVQVDCGTVQSGTCGNTTATQQCVTQNANICDGAQQISQNVWKTTKADTSTCSTQCGGSTASGGCATQVCTPGATKTQACTAACNLAGSQTLTCQSDGCAWSTPAVCEPTDSTACVPGTVKTGQACPTCPGALNPPNATQTCQSDCHTWDVSAQCQPCN